MERVKKYPNVTWKQIMSRPKMMSKRLLRQQSLCIAVSLGLMGLSYYMSSQNEKLMDGNRLQRESYGGHTDVVRMNVQGFMKKIPVEIRVSPRRYTKEEADRLFLEIAEGIEGMITVDGQSLAALSGDLKLPAELTDKGVVMEWAFYPDPDPALLKLNQEETREYRRKYRGLITKDGKVHNEELPEGSVVTGYLSLIMSTYTTPKADGEDLRMMYYADPVKVYVNVVPREKTEAEITAEALSREIRKADEDHLEKADLELPTEINGKRISYEEKPDMTWMLFPVLGVGAAVMLQMRQESEKKENRKKRDDSLMMDYSDLVSKLMVYIGAGLTVRNAFEKITEGYLIQTERGIIKPRALTEELQMMQRQFQRNMPESEIYTDFAKRIGLKPYTKLVSLIEQNRKNGTKNIRILLRMEMDDAFEERKNTAKRLGEEAGTKMLGPLFIQLGIVMVMVIVPAMSVMA